MKIAVLGGGHGAYAAAADLSEQGHEVRLWRRDADAFAPVLASSAITLIDERGTRPVKIASLFTSAVEAVQGVRLPRLAADVDAREDARRFGDAGEPLLDDFGVKVLEVEVDVVLLRADAASFPDLDGHRARDDIARGEVLGVRGVALHETLAGGIRELNQDP